MRIYEILREATGVGSGIIVDPNYKPTTPVTPATSKPLTPQVAPIKPVVKPVTEPAPFIPSTYKDLLTKIARASGLTKASDLASFLGQCQIETSGWTKATENFNYTDPNRIYKVFTSNFPSPQHATQYVGNPTALANRALAGKNGNGDESSGDGWKYRGRGFIHLTGRGLYAEAGAATHPENPTIYVDHPELISSNPKEAALASIWYFKKKVGLGKTSKQASKKVNPAGLKSAERTKATQTIKTQLAAARSPQAAKPKRT